MVLNIKELEEQLSDKKKKHHSLVQSFGQMGKLVNPAQLRGKPARSRMSGGASSAAGGRKSAALESQLSVIGQDERPAAGGGSALERSGDDGAGHEVKRQQVEE